MTDAMWAFAGDVGDTLLAIGVGLLRITLIVAIAVIASWVARSWVEPMLSRRAFGRNGALLIGRLLSVAAFIVAFLVILAQFGANWTGLLTVFSAFTVAIGLALQDVMKNFFSGILLLVERPFAVGDRVRVRDVRGEVQGIDIRTTLIRNTDGALVMVPNSIMFTEVLTNASHFRTRRVDLRITSATLRIDEIERKIVDALSPVEGVRKPIPAPVIRTSSSESRTLQISILIDASDDVEDQVMRTLVDQLADATIERAE